MKEKTIRYLLVIGVLIITTPMVYTIYDIRKSMVHEPRYFSIGDVLYLKSDSCKCVVYDRTKWVDVPRKYMVICDHKVKYLTQDNFY